MPVEHPAGPGPAGNALRSEGAGEGVGREAVEGFLVVAEPRVDQALQPDALVRLRPAYPTDLGQAGGHDLCVPVLVMDEVGHALELRQQHRRLELAHAEVPALHHKLTALLPEPTPVVVKMKHSQRYRRR